MGILQASVSQVLHDPVTGRRGLLRISLSGGLAALAPTIAASAAEPGKALPVDAAVPMPPLPIVDARFPAEMAPGVFIVPDKRVFLVPNVGIIVGRESVLVIDSGFEPESGESLLKLARRLAPGRQIILTVTHAHPEHCFGAQAFKPDAHIYYNAAQRDYLARAGATLRDGFRAHVLPPERSYLLDGVVLTPPDQVYDGNRATLDLGGRQVEFRTWGTAHSPGDQIVYLPAERIVFSGDLIEERMFPIVPFFPPMIQAKDIDAARWEMALNEMFALQPRLIVPGHGNLGGPEIATDVLEYLKTARTLFQTAKVSDDVLDQRMRALHPTWEHSEFIPPARRYFSLAA